MINCKCNVLSKGIMFDLSLPAHRNDEYSSQPTHTYVEICSGNMLFDSNVHKSNSHSEVELKLPLFLL